MHVMIKIMIVTAVLLNSTPNNTLIALAINGVAKLKVVAVPAINANTARRSISLTFREPDDMLPNISACLFFSHGA